VGLQSRKRVDQLERDIPGREGDALDPCDERSGLSGEHPSDRQADRVDLASVSEHDGAEHDGVVAAVGPVAEVEIDSELAPLLLHATQPVGELPGPHVDRAPEG